MPETTSRGRFVWHDLLTTEPDAATRFYPRVTGWTVQQWDEDPSYRMWVAGGVPIGGVTRLPDEARRMGASPHWMPHITVPDVDATIRQATGIGGRIVAPARDLSVGRYAVLADPSGAIVSVFKPAPTSGGGPPDDAVPMMGDFSWHELATKDYKAAWDYYRALFGWVPKGSFDMGPAGTYWMFGRPGVDRALGGMYNKGPNVPNAHWLCYVRVASADRAAQTTAGLGGRVTNGPMDVPGGDRVAMLADPQGAAFAVDYMPEQAKGVEKKPVKKKGVKKKGVGKSAKKKSVKKKK